MELTLEEIVQAICHLNVESHFIDLDGLPPEVLVYEALVGLEGIKAIVSFVYCQHSIDTHLHLKLNTYYNKASREWIHTDRKSTRLNSSHSGESRMPSSA